MVTHCVYTVYIYIYIYIYTLYIYITHTHTHTHTYTHIIALFVLRLTERRRSMLTDTFVVIGSVNSTNLLTLVATFSLTELKSVITVIRLLSMLIGICQRSVNLPLETPLPVVKINVTFNLSYLSVILFMNSSPWNNSNGSWFFLRM